MLDSGPSYLSAIAEVTDIGVETARRNLMVLKRLGYVTNWIHTFNEGTLTNIAVSAWRLLTDAERLERRIDPNRNRKSLSALNAKIRLRYSRTRELHEALKEEARPDETPKEGESSTSLSEDA